MKNKKLLVCLLAMIMMVFAVTAAMAATVEEVQALIDAAADGATIQLPGQIEVSSGSPVLSANRAVTIDASSITDAFKVNSGAALTLGANITITSDTAILWANGGTINIEGTKLIKNGMKYNLGFAEAGGIINVKSGSSVHAENTNRVTLDVVGNGSQINVMGGSVTSAGSSVISARESAVVTISGGTVETTYSGSEDYAAVFADDKGKIVITGGTVKAATDEAVHINPNSSASISGGTIQGAGALGSVFVEGTGSMIVSGGTFSDDKFEPYLNDNLDSTFQNGMFVVTRANGNVPAADGGSSSHSHPKTGDETNLVLLAVLLVASALGMTFMRKKACR